MESENNLFMMQHTGFDEENNLVFTANTHEHTNNFKTKESRKAKRKCFCMDWLSCWQAAVETTDYPAKLIIHHGHHWIQ